MALGIRRKIRAVRLSFSVRRAVALGRVYWLPVVGRAVPQLAQAEELRSERVMRLLPRAEARDQAARGWLLGPELAPPRVRDSPPDLLLLPAGGLIGPELAPPRVRDPPLGLALRLADDLLGPETAPPHWAADHW